MNQDWTYNNVSSSTSSTSRLFISSKYAPLTNITPTQSCLQHSFIYRPSWESSNIAVKSSRYCVKSRYGADNLSFSKSKTKSKQRIIATGQTTNKSNISKSKRSTSGFDYSFRKELDSKSGQIKYDGRNVHIKEEPVSDTDIRHESESDTDSDTEKKKSGKKLHDKNSSKKGDKGQKSKISDKTGQVENSSLYGNNGNSDDNSNDSGHNFNAVKSEPYQKTNVKLEQHCSTDNMIQRDDASGQTTNNTNLDKSSSSVEEFDNEKPIRVVKVNINLDYDSEVYNEEVNIRKFHKYQRNIEMANNLTTFDPFATDAFQFECDTTIMVEDGQQMNYSSSESDSEDSDGNDLDDSDNSSCDECANGAYNASVLPPLQNCTAASSPAMSISSYYNKNGEQSYNITK